MVFPTQPFMPHPTQPFPRFYVIRPDHTIVPLLAMDELPTWLQVGNWDWSDPALFHSMIPASFHQIPRIGEYDVICHYCCSGLETLQRSISQQSDNPSQNPKPQPTDDRRSFTTYPGASRDPSREFFPAFPGYQHYSMYGEPPLQTNFRSPYAGFCLVDWRCPDTVLYSSHSTSPWTSSFWSPSRPVGCVKPQKDHSGRSSSLNPEACDFKPPPGSKGAIDSPSSSSREDEFKANIFSPNSAWTSLSSGLRQKPSVGPDTRVGKASPANVLDKAKDLGSQSGRCLSDMVSGLKQVLGIDADPKAPQTSKEHTSEGAGNNIQGKIGQGSRYTESRTHGHPSPKGRRYRRGHIRVRHQIRRKETSTGEDGHSRKAFSLAARRRRARKMRRHHSEVDRRSRYWQVMQSPNWREDAGKVQ
ncbi:hypothetical protein VTN77DRAFT_2085 [Rasamsonia byssochlamydoides]|uniref:uncharacterized protein n=1 Tax=Rasamsonia byssochlamydoides TaxID=89139 RepID=UPI003743E2E8